MAYEKQGVQGSLFIPWLDRICRSPLCPVLLWVGVVLYTGNRTLPQEKSPGLDAGSGRNHPTAKDSVCA